MIVGVYDDDLVSQYKGKEYPILNLNERVLSILALRCVDEVIIGAPWEITQEICKTIKCKYVVQDYISSIEVAQNLTDPNQYPKSQGIYKVIRTETDFTLNTILERLGDNIEPYLSVYQTKVVRQEDYYNHQINDAIEITDEVKATDD